MTIINSIQAFMFGRQSAYDYDPKDEDNHPAQILHDWLSLYALEFTKDWPEVEHDGEFEDVDLENVEIIRLTDDLIELDAGGDWQDQTKMIIEYVGNELTCTSAIPCEDFGNGYLSSNEIAEILKVK